MKTSSRDLGVGLFVLISLVLLGWMIVEFGAAPRALRNTYTLTIEAPTAGPIAQGADVRVAGVTVGQITRIQPVDQFRGGVVMTAEIEADYRIPAGSYAVIGSSGLSLGTPSLDIVVPPDAGEAVIPPGGRLQARAKSPLQMLLGDEQASQFTAMTHSLAKLTHNFNMLLEPRPMANVDCASASQPETMANLTTAVQRFDTTLKRINELLAQGGDLSTTLSNFRQVSQDARQIAQTMQLFADRAVVVADKAGSAVESANQTFAAAQSELKRVTDSLVDNSRQLAAALDKVNANLQAVSEGHGSLGKLVHDPGLYENMLLASDRLHQAIIDLQRLLEQWKAEGVAIKLK